MQKPLQVSFHQVPVSPEIEQACLEEAAKLEQFDPHIIGCRVVVSEPHRRHQQGHRYDIRIEVRRPGKDVTVSRHLRKRKDDEHPEVAVREAFAAARRQLEERVSRHRRQVKTHEPPDHGQVVYLDGLNRHGFLETPEGDQVYFHENALLDVDFESLEPGDELIFVEQQGQQGPQASSVRRPGRHHQPTP
jgi:cold shock CspA family protein